ncbi:MAG: polyhydroxyalkanoic acid system family protein [Nanoarchaeota archaeon]|nr:polyhydroxyalkanoic acid system family protein [Nanoarchaeota archaeon]
MKLVYQHNLPNKVSYKKIDCFLTELQKRYSDKISSPKSHWNSDYTQMDFSVGIMGFSTQGKIYLKEDKIILELELPFVLSVFSKKIKEMIKQQFEALLSTSN